MNKLLLIGALLLSGSQCDAATERAYADDPVAAPAEHGQASRAWQASYAAEAANDPQAAIQALARLPAAQSGGYLANYRRGWLQYRLGRYPDAVLAYESAIRLEPAAIEPRLALLSALAALSRWQEIAQQAGEVLKRDPENYTALQRLAFARFSTQHYAEAEQLYRRLLQAYPSDLDTRAGLAWAALRMGKQREAAALFAEVLELSPQHASASASAGLAEASTRRKSRF